MGTPLYVAPEMLEHNQAGIFTDLWALGCIIYELLVGKNPFYEANSNQVFQNILDRNIEFPRHLDNHSRDIIDKLLKLNPYERLGYASYADLKMHPFFDGIDFEKLNNREVDLP